MHLADAFIQSDLQCIQAIHLYCQYMCSLGIEPTTFVLLMQCSTTEPQEHIFSVFNLSFVFVFALTLAVEFIIVSIWICLVLQFKSILFVKLKYIIFIFYFTSNIFQLQKMTFSKKQKQHWKPIFLRAHVSYHKCQQS